MAIGAIRSLGNLATRFAGEAGKKVIPALRNTMKVSPDSGLAEDLIKNFGLDAAFGIIQGVTTPGDLREKLIAGTTTAVGGGIGGLGLSAALPVKLRNNQAFRQPVELIGGVAGDFAGQAIGDQAQRLTSADGKTAYERLAEEERRQIEQRTLAAIGLGGYNLNDLIGMV